MASHKYIERKWKNGRWEYKYRTDDRNSDQYRRDMLSEKDYRARMLNQSHKAFNRELKKDSQSRDTDRAAKALIKNDKLYNEHIGWDFDRIENPDAWQDQLRKSYKSQSLGTKIKAGARSAADDAKEQAGKAKKTVAEKTAAAKKMATDATRKVSSLSSKAVDKGKATISKILDKFKKK